MHPVAIIVVLTMLLLGISSRNATESLLRAEESRREVMAGSMQVMAAAAGSYVRAYPGATGNLNPATVGVPSWLVIPVGSNAAAARTRLFNGRAYAWLQMSSVQSAAAVAAHCGEGAQCAVTQGGRIIQVSDQTDLGPSPTGIPTDAAFVVVY